MKLPHLKRVVFVSCLTLFFSASGFAQLNTLNINNVTTPSTITNNANIGTAPLPPPTVITPQPMTLPGQTPTQTNIPVTDSSQLNRALVVPNTNAMQIVTQVSVPCQTSMQQIDNWVTLPANQCGPNNTKSICYVQLSATPQGASTNNILSCPLYYSPLFSYGDSILDSTNQGKYLVYTPSDSELISTEDQFNFYNGTTGTNYYYQCSASGSEVDMGSDTETGSTATPTAPASYPSSRYQIGNNYTVNGLYVYVNQISGNPQCYLAGGTSAGLAWCTAPVCPFTTYCSGAYITETFEIYAQRIYCRRDAGFYPPVNGTTPFPLPQPSTKYSPTILICGKVQTLWKSVNPNGRADTNQCVNLP